MLRKHLLLALFLATSVANAESWTVLHTLGRPAVPADGQYDVRLTLLDAETSSPRMNPITLHGVAIASGTFAVEFELGAAMQEPGGQTVDSLILKTELSSDGANFIALSTSLQFDPASTQGGVCSDYGETTSGRSEMQNASVCLMPKSLLDQMGPSGGAYELKKQVIAGGGRLVSSGSYALIGTVGQSAVTRVSGGFYQLTGGFHSAAIADPPGNDLIFRNGFEN